MKRTFPLLAAFALTVPAAAAEPAVEVKKTKDAIEFSTADGLIARYHIAPTVAKPYFWPVNAPGGVPVTRGWPMEKGLPNETTDHVHQKSVWFCHGDVIPEGLELKVRSSDKRVKGVDFWAESKGHGIIVCVAVGEPRAGTGAAGISTRNEWRAPDGTKILDEERAITVRAIGGARLIVLDIDLHASVCPITFGDTKEGSMGVRVNDQIRLEPKKGDTIKTEGVVTAADGKTARTPARENLPMWGKPADWHDYSGTVDGKPVGIAVFDHPNNPRASWHTRAYGLMAANPFGRGGSFPSQKGKTDLVRIEKGGELKLRYAVYAHTGDAKTGKVAETYEAFKAMK